MRCPDEPRAGIGTVLLGMAFSIYVQNVNISFKYATMMSFSTNPLSSLRSSPIANPFKYARPDMRH